jgi:uncharacterized protein
VTEDRTEYAKYRIESAHKTFQAAKVLTENEFWNSAVNRLYYAVFYAVNALLVLHNVQTKSHSATKSQFSFHFIKTGKLDKKYGQLFTQLFDWRQKGDYESVFEYDKDSVNPLFEPVEEMIDAIKREVERGF